MKTAAFLTRTVGISLLDCTALLVLIVAALLLIHFYWNAELITPGYPDWLVHAYRVKSLQSEGYLSWTHQWANGISVWKAYQFVPHYMTLAFTFLFNVSITRAMVLMTIFLFVLLRVFIYVTLRILHISPTVAFLSTILSFDIAQYWGGVSDYSLLFGFTFFPLIIVGWIFYLRDKMQYLYPFLLGLSFYMHPILGYVGFALYLFSFIFTSRKVLSLKTGVQISIFLISSLLFWLPIVFKESYTYTNPYLGDRFFLAQVISAYSYYGLSLFVCLTILIGVFFSFKSVDVKYLWAKILFGFLVLYGIFIILAVYIDLPRAISQFQFTRGATLVGIGLVYIFAVCVQNFFWKRDIKLKIAVIIFILASTIESYFIINTFSPRSGTLVTDAVASYREKNLTDGKIWSSDIGTSSYLAPSEYQFPYSYMGHLDSNIISPRIAQLINYGLPYDVPYSTVSRISDYFKITGVKYIFLDETSRLTQAILYYNDLNFQDMGSFRTGERVVHVFQVPWNVVAAREINQGMDVQEVFPMTLNIASVSDQIKLDSLVKIFNSKINVKNNTPLSLSYPSPESINVHIPQKRSSSFIYINESYDAHWKAYFKGKEQTLSSFGPNFIMVKLSEPGSGTLTLKHSLPFYYFVALFFILFIPSQIFVINFAKRFYGKN